MTLRRQLSDLAELLRPKRSGEPVNPIVHPYRRDEPAAELLERLNQWGRQ